jgi:hypothetical protein
MAYIGYVVCSSMAKPHSGVSQVSENSDRNSHVCGSTVREAPNEPNMPSNIKFVKSILARVFSIAQLTTGNT